MLHQIKASAGSGKTFALTSSFLDLLAGAVDRPAGACGQKAKEYSWPEITAITFTNKAAAEMKDRIVSSLKGHVLGLDDKVPADGLTVERAEHLLSLILRRYNQLNVRTIDSLLNLILRLFALNAGLSPDFQTVFDQATIFDPVLERFAERCEEEDSDNRILLKEAVLTLLRFDGRSGFNLADVVQERLRGLLSVLATTENDLETDREVIASLMTWSYDEFLQGAKALQDVIERDKLKASKHMSNFMAKSLATALFDGPPSSAFTSKESLQDCVLKASKDKVSMDAETVYIRFKDACEVYAQERAILQGAYSLSPGVAITRTLLDEVNEFQRLHGLVLNDRIPGLVAALLDGGEAAPEAWCRMGTRLRHMLIDEFQDTSRTQWLPLSIMALECLSQGGNLLYVGDVKQAIYGWRGGDARLFDEIGTQADIAAIADGSKASTLPNNWRSKREVIEFNNDFFSAFEESDVAEELAAKLLSKAPDFAIEQLAADIAGFYEKPTQEIAPGNADSQGYIRLKRLPGGGDEEIVEQTEEAFHELIDELSQRRPWKDIAILVRTNNHAALVCDWLVSRNIPVITENSLLLSRHPIVRGLAALMGFLDYPLDDSAFFGFISCAGLLPPEGAPSSEDLHDWLSSRPKSPLAYRFKAEWPEVWERHIAPFFLKSGIMTAYDTAREAVERFGLLERFPGHELYIRRFLEVVFLAEEQGQRSLSGFLEFWKESGDEEKVPLPADMDAVRIITVHKSKGLEFPVVIIPFHTWRGDRPDRDYAVCDLHSKRFLTPMRKDLGAPYWESRSRVALEQLNMLYVAWTRPEEELYGFLPEKTTRGLFPPLVAAREILDDRFDENGLYELGTPAEAAPSTEADQHPGLPFEVDDDRDLMQWLPRLRVYRHALESGFLDGKLRGEIIHKGMEYLRVTGDDDVDAERAALLALEDYPTVAEEHEGLLRDIKKAALWFLSEPELRDYVHIGEPEVPLLTATGDTLRVDLLARDDKRLVAIEYKTGQPTPDHERQLKNYLANLSALLHDGPPPEIYGVLVYLDLHKIVRVQGGAA